MSQPMRNVVSIVVAVTVAAIIGCRDDSITNPETNAPPEPQGLTVSSPMSLASASGVVASQDSLAFVSLVPGTAPSGVSATIQNSRKGVAQTVAVIEGGFDPVGIPASIGDTVDVAVANAADLVVFRAVAAIKSPHRPVVVRTSPPANKTDIPLNIIMQVVFSAPIDSTTLTTGSVQLLQGTSPVLGTVRFVDGAHLRAEFHADSPLAPQTDYQLVVTAAILDVNGLALDSAVTVPFRTGTIAPTTNLVFASVSVGFHHACGVTTAGSAYCWGDNYVGILGDGTTNSSSIPVAVAGGLTFANVSAGYSHTCGVTTSGAAYCWGAGGLLLGDGPNGKWSPAPVPVVGELTFASVSAGYVHTCGVTTAGAAYCWGEGYYGELGGGSPSLGASTPQAVAGGLTFASVSAGGDHSCGVTTTGATYCWGQNTLGELGIGTSTGPERCINGDTLACSTLPVPVAGGLTFANVSTGYSHTCGVTTTAAPYCWGNTLHGLLGNGVNATGPEECANVAGIEEYGPVPCSRVPATVAGGEGLDLASVSTGGGDRFACGLTSSGRAYCWGEDFDRTTPVAVAGGLTFATLSAGLSSTCGVTTAGVAYCWGANESGQLGDGTTTPSYVPVKVAGQQ